MIHSISNQSNLNESFSSHAIPKRSRYTCEEFYIDNRKWNSNAPTCYVDKIIKKDDDKIKINSCRSR